MDLEDTKRRLAFSDTTVKCRCMGRLISTIKQKVAKYKITSASSAQFPEINLLLETCGSDCLTTSLIACDGLIQLVSCGVLDHDYVVSNILNILSSSRNTCGIINVLAKLLLLQVDGKNDSSNKNIPLSLLKHPFVMALERKPECWSEMLDTIIQMVLNNPRNSSLLEPVISFIFLSPSDVSEYALLRQSLIPRLLKNESTLQVTLDFFLSILPWLQISNANQVTEIVILFSHLKTAIYSMGEDDKKQEILEKFLFASLSLYGCCLKYGHSPIELLYIIQSISNDIRKENAQSCYFIASFPLLSVLLGSSFGNETQELINIGCILLKNNCPPKLIAAMLLVPVIILLSEPKVLSSQQNTNTSLTSLCKRLEYLLSLQTSTNNFQFDALDSECWDQFTSLSSLSLMCAKFVPRLETASEEEKIEWLNHVKYKVAGNTSISEFLFHLTSAQFLCSSKSEQLFCACLEVFESMTSSDNNLSTRMFPILLYKLMNESEPERHLLIMENLANTASHKYAVSPILNSFNLMAQNPELKSQAIYLMFQLFQKQERCFAFLQKLLSTSDSTVSLDTNVCETRITQAAVIKELCIQKPERYGKESLSALSTIINQSNDAASTPAVVLALDGVIHLCKSGVIDLRSAWKNLSMRLCRDKRTPIIVRVCHMLHLVPSLQVKSFEYDKFMKESAAYLLRLISFTAMPPAVISAAYSALSDYPLDCFTLKQLPAAAKTNLKLPAHMAATPFEMGKLPEDVLNYIPGYCFTDLLKNLEDVSILEGYEKFLHSLIKEEISEMPRSIYNRKKQQKKKRNANDILSNIPGILCTNFESQKSSVIQKSLAVGILLSYEAPVQLNKDGKPIMRSVATQYRLYEQVLSMLLNEVNLDCNDWLRCLILPSAWASFMERAVFACEESRKAELDISKSENQLKGSPEEIGLIYSTVWMWIRDRLLDLIKIASKNTSASHANSMFAIAGLVSAVNKFYANMDEEEKKSSDKCDKHISHKAFQLQCTESLLCAFDFEYRPKSKILGWLLTHLPKGSTSAGATVKGCAAASLYHVLPVIKVEFSDIIKHLCSVFLQSLSSENSGTLTIYSGIGLGFFIKGLCSDSSCDYHNDLVDIILEVVESLDAGCKIEEFVNGKLIALTLGVSGMCLNRSHLFTPWIKNICEYMQERIKNENPNAMLYEFVSVCSSGILASAAAANIVPIHVVKDAIHWFEDRRNEMPQCSSTAVSLSILVDSLTHLGDPKGIEISEDLQKQWFSTLSSEKKPTLHRIASLNGLCSLFSGGKGLLQISKDLASGSVSDGLKDFIQLMLQLLGATRDQSLQNICCWELGHMFFVHASQQDLSSSSPSTYSYLSERSILRYLMSFIHEAIESNYENGRYRNHVLIGLKVIGGHFSRPLPPLDWVAIFAPFLQESKDFEMNEFCLKISLNQMSSSKPAFNLMSSYATPPLFHSLSENCQLMFVKNIQILAINLPLIKLQSFLQAALLAPIRENKMQNGLKFEVIQNFLKILKEETCSEELKALSFDTLKHILLSMDLTKEFQNECWNDITFLLIQWPEKLHDQFLREFENTECLHIYSFILSLFIQIAKKPITSFRSVVELGKHADAKTKNLVLSTLLNCFVVGQYKSESDLCKPDKQIAFLLETIGWLNVTMDPTSKYQLSNINEIARFLLDVCLSVIIGSAGFNVSYVMWPEAKINHDLLMKQLPNALGVLAQKNRWQEVMEKIINWLLFLKKSKLLSTGDKSCICSSFCALRFTKAFQKPALWTDVISTYLIEM